MGRQPRKESELLAKAKTLRRLLSELLESDSAVVVEGKKDREALLGLGVASERIFTVHGKPHEVAERVAAFSDRAYVLTDLDAAGEEIMSRIVPALEGSGVKPDVEMRRRMSGILQVRFFEEIVGKIREFDEKLEEIDR